MAKFITRKSGRAWEVWCRQDGFLKSFDSRNKAEECAKRHAEENSRHEIRVIGRQGIKNLLFPGS